MGNNGLYKANKTVIQLAIKTKKNKNKIKFRKKKNI